MTDRNNERRPAPASADLQGSHAAIRQNKSHPERTAPTLAELSSALRDEGIARADGSLDTWTRRCWETAIRYWAATGIPFGADEIRELGVPEPKSPGAAGAQFMAAARNGLIRPHGFVQSNRPTRHRSWQRQWIGSEAA